MPAKNMMIAMAFMVCITLRLKLVGRLGSFFLKKYMNKFNKKRRPPVNGEPSEYLFYLILFCFQLNAAV